MGTRVLGMPSLSQKAHNKFIKHHYGQKTASTGRAKNARRL
jgi:hypothetical protein